jgi:WD40 repeat protein
MTTASARLIALALWLSVVLLPMRAFDSPSAMPARVDALGDPLPEGAVARLGTVRLRHRGPVTAVAVSPDSQMLASGAWPITRLADLADKRDSAREFWAETSPQGICLWGTRTGKLLRELETHNGKIYSLLFSADDTADLYAVCGTHICCWNSRTGEKRWELFHTFYTRLPAINLALAGDHLISVHAGPLECQVDGENSTTSHKQMAVRFWNRKTGAPIRLPASLESTGAGGKEIPVLFHAAAVSPDGQTAALVMGSGHWPSPSKGGNGKNAENPKQNNWQYTNSSLRIIDLGTGAVRHDFPASSVENARLSFSDDGRLVASAAGNEIWLVDTASGRQSRIAAGVPILKKLRFVSGTQRIAAQFADQAIRVWDYTTGRPIDAHGVRDYHFHASGRSPIIAIGQGTAIRLVDSDSGQPLLNFAGHRETPSIHLRPGPDTTLTSFDTEEIYRWEAGTWKMRDHMRLPPKAEFGWHGPKRSSVSPVSGLRVEDGGKALEIYDLKSGKLVRPLENSAGKQRLNFFSPDGTRVISMEEQRIVFFDVNSGKRLATIEQSGRSSVVSPLGTLIARSDEGNGVELIQVDDGKQLRKLSGDKEAGPDPQFTISQLWFSQDQRFILAETHHQPGGNSGQESAGIALWEIETGTFMKEAKIISRELSPLQIQFGPARPIPPIVALAMSPDGRLIALARTNYAHIEILDTISSTRRGVLRGHEGAISDLAFSQDGRYLVSASDDTTVLVWDMNRPLQAATFDVVLTETKLAESWDALTDADASRAVTATWQLVKAKSQSVAFIKARLKPRPLPDSARLWRLINELDNDNYKTRSLAGAELESLGETALAELKAALTQNASLERQRRIQRLLPQAERAALPFGTTERVREWRVLEVLERIANPEAVALLEALASGAPRSPLTVRAAEVLARLRRASKP